MSEETTETTEVTSETNEFPWKKIMFALATGAAAAGGTYVLTRKVNVDSESDSDETETPEA